ncbi:hypothetical protein HanXRQr2_Chr15g0682421 [Helianthus annuus]|uniref:Uncharacterized protein n=1 Tax=Helianthus annuus TaxID=4232 RepID=A0A9K3H3M6_HELAN|nr:hypothetical protein HanXRQr2_Chr15g0682421 [Helianthus annuus]KAJ0830343.1 hypothetical protein HanPSC8_Chr15g0654351 [Helianthus annuus]
MFKGLFKKSRLWFGKPEFLPTISTIIIIFTIINTCSTHHSRIVIIIRNSLRFFAPNLSFPLRTLV